MKIISLKCNNCSADLEIPEHTNFFNCSFCKSSLGIKRSGNAVFTEVLSEIKEDTGQILDLSENILVEKQIARLDRDWEQTQKKYTTYNNGSPSLPDEENSTKKVMTLMLAGIAIFFFLFIFSSLPSRSVSHTTPKHPFQELTNKHMEEIQKRYPNSEILPPGQVLTTPRSRIQKPTPPYGMMVFALIFTFGLVLFFSMTNSSDAQQYKKAKESYLRQRAELLNQLEHPQ